MGGCFLSTEQRTEVTGFVSRPASSTPSSLHSVTSSVWGSLHLLALVEEKDVLKVSGVELNAKLPLLSPLGSGIP